MLRYSTLLRKPLFDKILIANRGEISVRIMQTAKKLGIKTVAVYSDADRNSMHTKMADEAYYIGASPSSESYLRMEKIIQVAKDAGAGAIHPGYGFLSENAAFAGMVRDAGLVFIGPPVDSIVKMGSKSASKEIMLNAKVPCVPGYHGSNQDALFLKQQADSMGYPIMIKAIKGGGGKGMRIVESSADFMEMLESSRREATKSFGDDAVLIEKYLTIPRHVEVQVFADKLGNAVYLFERDCSVQRRHQKIIEEAPAPGLSEAMRKALGEKAVAAAKAVKYEGAGTVEFILDTLDDKFYFMEMNTRLQVEHPVTEMVTGTDLVQWQLEVAAGNRLPKLQSELQLDGHAFEARIYAENPRNNFMPDVGDLVHMRPPVETDDVRVETGVREGDSVSVFYDPMICKLVVKGRDRTEALRVLRKALGEFEVVGPQTNIGFLKALAGNDSFVRGDVDTGFIGRHTADLFPSNGRVDGRAVAQAALGIVCQREFARKNTADSFDVQSPWSTLNGIRLNHSQDTSFEFMVPSTAQTSANVASEKVKADLRYDSETELYTVLITSKSGEVKTMEGIRLYRDEKSAKDFDVEIDGRRDKCTVVQHAECVHLFSGGVHTIFEYPTPSYLKAAGELGHFGDVVTPMPCKISQIMVKAGDMVKKGQPLLVLEAMKMEHVMRAPVDGVVKKVLYKSGDLVGDKKRLVVFED